MAIITRIVLQGFRGANKPLEIKVPGSMIISGPTGSGKTTVLQAIEWGLYGKILGFTGPGFTSEDAYVNLFSDTNLASVTVDLSLADGTKISIQRERKEAARSTVGKTSVQLTQNGDSFSGSDAEEQIENLIGLDHEKFTQAIFLHQETLRLFIEGRPQDRSAIIDQLLGTVQLREFAQALDPKRKIKSEINALQTTKDRLEGEQTMVEVDSQEQLDIQRDQLLAEGYNKTDLSLGFLSAQLDHISTQLTQLAKSYSVAAPSPLEKIHNVDDVTTAREQIDSALRDLDRSRGERITEIKTESSRLEELVKQYRTALEELGKKGKPKKNLEEQITALDLEKTSLLDQQNQLREQANLLDPLVSAAERLTRQITEQEGELKQFIENEGDQTQLETNKTANTNQIEQLQKETKEAGALAQLLSAAHSFIKDTTPSSCPVCDQEIKHEAILRRLEAENAKQGQKLGEKQKTIESLDDEIRRIDSLLSQLKQMKGGITSLKDDFNSQLQDISSITGKEGISVEDAAKLIKANRKQAEALEGQIETVKDKIWQLEQERDGIQRLDDTLGQLERSLQEFLSVKLIKQRLIKAAEKRLQTLRDKTETIQDTTPIDKLREHLDSMNPVLVYLRNVEDFDKRREEQSLLEKHMDFIDKQIQELEDLEASLETLRDIISEHQSALTEKALGVFQNSIEHYYNQVIAHPYFQKIQIRPLPTDPVSYDILASDEGSSVETHINTRFSTAQINATALAIFFSVNQALAEKLPIVILDDPTQNMDQTHQEALAQTLAILAKNRQLLIASHNEQFVDVLKGHEIDLEQLTIQQWTPEGPQPG